MNQSEEAKIVEQAELYVMSLLGTEDSGHDFDHCLRVYHLACRLMEKQPVNPFIVKLASLLHDIDDPKLDINADASQQNKVQMFLESCHVAPTVTHEVTDIITNMSYSSYLKGKRVHSLEGQIVQDADRLDALGAIGIARTFSYGSHKNRRLYAGKKDDETSIAHFYEKLLKLPGLLNTRKARRMAVSRLRLMKRYLRQFHREWEEASGK